jgi:hypothetical protein
MKMIFAVIQPTKLDAVQQALPRLDGQRGGQAHFAPKTPQNEPVPSWF